MTPRGGGGVVPRLPHREAYAARRVRPSRAGVARDAAGARPGARHRRADRHRAVPRRPAALPAGRSGTLASFISTYALKRARSDCTARFTNRMPDAIFSIIPFGSNSMSIMTRVRLSPSLWKLTTPLCDMPLVVFQAMRSYLRRSVMRPSQSRLLNQTFSWKRTLSSPSSRRSARGA